MMWGKAKSWKFTVVQVTVVIQCQLQLRIDLESCKLQVIFVPLNLVTTKKLLRLFRTLSATKEDSSLI